MFFRMLSLRVLSHRFSSVMRRKMSSFDPLEAKIAQKKAEKLAVYEKQHDGYVTSGSYQKSVIDQRSQGAVDAESGHQPTRWQKRFLVLTRLYKSKNDIPEFVHRGTMGRMHDRLRVVFIVLASVGFFSIFYISEILNARRHTMGIFRKVLMNAAGVHGDEPKKGSYEWKKSNLSPEQMARTMDNSEKYHGVPAIPTDIGFSSGKNTSGKKESGVVSQATSNPAVILGMGLTTAALLGMFKSSFVGDKIRAQKFMQYRIMAQFFTVTALVAGVTFFGATYDDEK